MKQKLLTFLLLVWATLIVCATGKAQTVVLQQPDCQQFFSLTIATSSASYDNRFNGCTFWTASYGSRGFSALTFAVQSASNATGDIPGSFGTFSGTVLTGNNPSTVITQAYTELVGFNPWVRVNLSGLTGMGSVQGTLYGWKLRPANSSSGGGCSDPCTVIQPTAANLNATVVGAGTAGTPNVGVVTIQGISSGTAVVVGGAAADGAARSGNPVPMAGRDTANNTQDVQTNTTGRPLVVQASTALALADAISNTIATPNAADISDASSTTPSTRTMPMVFNGATWDRLRGTIVGVQTQGAAADGAAVAGNPVLIAGFDGTNAQSISTNSSGQINIVCISGCSGGSVTATSIGPNAPGAASTANPVQIAGNDGAAIRAIVTDTSGRTIAVGAAAVGAAVSGNPVRVGGTDTSGNARAFQTNTTGNILIGTTLTGFGDSQSNNINQVKGSNNDPAGFMNFPYMFNGTSWDRSLKCISSVAFDLTGTGNTQIIAGAVNQNIRICHISLSGDATADVKLTRGTGSNCATGTTDVTGTYQDVTALALDFASPSPLLVAGTSTALCVNLSAGNWGGVVSYVQFQ